MEKEKSLYEILKALDPAASKKLLLELDGLFKEGLDDLQQLTTLNKKLEAAQKKKRRKQGIERRRRLRRNDDVLSKK